MSSRVPRLSTLRSKTEYSDATGATYIKVNSIFPTQVGKAAGQGKKYLASCVADLESGEKLTASNIASNLDMIPPQVASIGQHPIHDGMLYPTSNEAFRFSFSGIALVIKVELGLPSFGQLDDFGVTISGIRSLGPRLQVNSGKLVSQFL